MTSRIITSDTALRSVITVLTTNRDLTDVLRTLEKLMKTMIGRTLTALAIATMVVPAPVVAAESPSSEARVHDIRLSKAKEFTGLILTEKGRPVAGVPVQVLAGSKVIASVKTDTQGRYRVEGIRSGLHLVRTVNGHATCRFWNDDSAPPAAQPALMMTAYTTVVRGQNCGNDGCGESCEWNGCGEDCDGCGEGCNSRCGGGRFGPGFGGISKIVASPGGLMTLAAFSAVSVVTVTSSSNNSATLGGATTPASP